MIVKSSIDSTIQFLNKPAVKEGVKNIIGSITFAFGIVEVIDLYRILNGKEISTEAASSTYKWVRTAKKIIMFSAKISLVLSGAVSRPGVFLISRLVGLVFTAPQCARIFGPSTIFAINPRHPRHVASLAAAILGFPSTVETVCRGALFLYRKIFPVKAEPAQQRSSPTWLVDAKVRMMVLFNMTTCRPVLHFGNQYGRSLAKA